MLKDKLTVTIHSCAAFSDLWDAHALLLNRNWADRDTETILVTDDETDRHFDGIRVFSAGTGLEMPQRIKAVLPEIQTKFVLLTLDDYFPIHSIDSKKIERIVSIMETEKLDYVRLFPIPKSRVKLGNYENMFRVTCKEEYDVNLYQGIWRTDFLAKTVERVSDVWRYEVSLTGIAKAAGAACAMSTGNEFEILDVVRKGKILNKANTYLKKHDLYHGSRPVISRKTELLLWIKGHGKLICPKCLRSGAKWVLRKCGMKFYSDG